MTAVTVIGAGGKMGLRITQKLHASPYETRAVEIGEAGRKRLTDAGIVLMDQDAALDGADVVVLAIPDAIMGSVSHSVAERLPSGSMLLIMDAAAPFAGVLPERPDLTYFLGHPCHPPLFNERTDMAERKDYHGGIAPQSIVCALMQGPEEHYGLGEDICKTMWAPILSSYRVTTEQMAILEPGLSEMVALPFVDVMAKAVDACAKRGIPREAAFDFLIGHLNVELAMWFGYSPRVPSDAAERLLRWATPYVVNPDWEKVLDPDLIRKACELIADERAAGKPASAGMPVMAGSPR
jgi:D-apionate oxidoisomerase